MGKFSIKRPSRLAEKLLAIRKALELSQSEIIQSLGFDEEITQSQISAFERGSRIPSLPVLLAYARLAGVSTDFLIDDELDLPEKLPNKLVNNQ
jgi:transcriptional regulator with XRE-family HTH domain